MSFQLRRRGVLGGAAVGVVAMVATGTALAGAQTPGPALTVAPVSGPTGTSVSVSGDGCLGTEVALVLAESSDTLDLGSATPGEDGSWSGSLDVPDDDDLFGAQLTITADCLGGDVDYEPGSFSVDDPTPPTTTTSTTTSTSTTTTAPQSPGPSPTPTPTPTPPATTPTTTPPVTTPLPPPADPVETEPDFLG